jgi:hypothetical protein
MRVLNTVIYTDKLNAVREFYQKHFFFTYDEGEANSFGVLPFPEAKITYVDSAAAGIAPSQNVLLRLGMPFPIIERARLISEGVACGDLTVENWGSFYGNAVQYFVITDPSGSRIQLFEDRYGEDKQLMTTGDGTGTKKVQERQSHGG